MSTIAKIAKPTAISSHVRPGPPLAVAALSLRPARALLAATPEHSVLILDEPTSHLDVRGEAAFYDRFLDLTRGKTTVLISHRFSTVRRADSIVVLDGGRVVEQGSHDELLALNGRYARLFARQASRCEA